MSRLRVIKRQQVVLLGALNPLSFSSTSFLTGTPSSGTIDGSTIGSTITVSGLPAGLTSDGAARTWAWDGTGTISSGSFPVTETLIGASNSPRVSTISYTISAAGSVPAITRVTASGTKRENQTVWLEVQDDGSANKYKFDVQAGGVSLTGVIVRDGSTSASVSFPYVATSSAISFDVPTALVGTLNYALNGYASSDNGATWSSPVAAAENFSFASDMFTPASIATPTLTRTSTSGTRPMTFSVSGADLYDSYTILLSHYSSDGITLIETAAVGLSEVALTTPFTIDLSGNTDPTPVPSLSSMGANDRLSAMIISADYDSGNLGVSSGVTSAPSATISPTDSVVAQTWSSSDKASGVVLSAGNLDAAANTGAYQGVRGTNFKTGGKWYYEVKVIAIGNAPEIGWANSTASLNAQFGSDTNAIAKFLNSYVVWYNGGYVYTGPGANVNNDIIQLAADFTAGTFWWGTNGTWVGNPSAGTGGYTAAGPGSTLAPAFAANAGEVLAQFTAASQTYSPPTGFTAIG